MTDSEERAWNKVSDLEDKVADLEKQIEKMTMQELSDKMRKERARCPVCGDYKGWCRHKEKE